MEWGLSLTFMKALMVFQKEEPILNHYKVACLLLMVSMIIIIIIHVGTIIIILLEPGYYEDGAFGVRIENVELIKKVETKYQFDNIVHLGMEPLTLVCFIIILCTIIVIPWLYRYPYSKK